MSWRRPSVSGPLGPNPGVSSKGRKGRGSPHWTSLCNLQVGDLGLHLLAAPRRQHSPADYARDSYHTAPSTSTQGSAAHSPACKVPDCLSGSRVYRWLIPYPYVSDLKTHFPDFVSLSSQLIGAPKIPEPESATICPSRAAQRAFCPHPQPEGTFHLLWKQRSRGRQRSWG